MIKGELTGLRAVEKDDLPLLQEWRNIPEFRKNFREVRELNLKHQEKWFEKTCIESYKDFMFIIVDINNNEPIGAAGLLYVDWIIRSADLSFYIGKNRKYIDKEGFALDSAKLLIEYGFKTLNLHKIWMELYEFDKKKIDFFTKELDFKQDGILRDNCFENGKYWNSSIFSLINEEDKFGNN